MQRVLLVLFFSIIGVSCSEDGLAADGKHVKARAMKRSCVGTVLQFIDSTNSTGKDWLWFKDLDGPLDASNPAELYPKCVSAFGIPEYRQIIGDSLEFTYKELTNPPDLICAIGGLPNAYVSVENLKSK